MRNSFFSQVISSEAQVSFRKIKSWFEWLAHNNCFCPLDIDQPFDNARNISCYISSPGSIGNNPEDTCSVLRLRKVPRDGDFFTAIGNRLTEKYNVPLKKYCSWYSDNSISHNAMSKLSRMVVDLRGYIGSNLYDMAKHVRRLELTDRLPGLCGANSSSKPDNYLKFFQWKQQNVVTSMGFGVNAMALLGVSILMRTTNQHEIHSSVSSDFAHALLGILLRHFPNGVCPNNMAAVLDYNQKSCLPDSVVVHRNQIGRAHV